MQPCAWMGLARTGARQKILEMRPGTGQGWGWKAEHMVLAHIRTPGPRSRRHKDSGSAEGSPVWQPLSAATVPLNGLLINRRDAMDAEEDRSESLEALSLKGRWFECPPFPSFLCAHRVSAVRLHAPQLTRYGRGRLQRRAGRSSFGAVCLPWLVLLALCLAAVAPAAELYVRQSGWVETMLASRAALAAAGLSGPEQTKAAEQVWLRVKDDFPVQWDWALQDGGGEFATVASIG